MMIGVSLAKLTPIKQEIRHRMVIGSGGGRGFGAKVCPISGKGEGLGEPSDSLTY